MDPDLHEQLEAATRGERQRLVTLLSGLSPDQWGSPSLCHGWAVRDVVAHLTAPYRTPVWRMLGGLVRAGLSFDRYAARSARADSAAMGDAALLTALRDNVDTPWRPPGGGPAGALSHDVIHGLDVTEPLGLPAAPPERIALVLRHTSDRQLRYFGVDPGAARYVATDADVAIGSGPEIALSAREILLAVTGRT